MKITNNYNMPLIAEAYCRNKFSQEIPVAWDSIGVTALIDSAWKAHLTRLHQDDLTVDVRDIWFAFQGEMKHEALEKVPLWNALTGKLVLPIPFRGGAIKLRGIPDLLTPFTVTDHKTSKVAAVWYMEKDKHVEQLNLYKYLVEKVFQMPINRLVVNMFFNNWEMLRAGKDNYPEAPSLSYEVPVWTESEAEAYILSRLLTHFPMEGNLPPMCSEKERWMSKDTYAVMKKNNRRATKVCDSLEEAEEYSKAKGYELGKTHSLEPRKGVDRRCVGFCFVNKYCPYWQENYAGKEIAAAEE